jgi:AraC family transcriptional regulator
VERMKLKADDPFIGCSDGTDSTNEMPENVIKRSVKQRTWNGIHLDVTEWYGSGAVLHRFPHERDFRLVTLLSEVGSHCEPRLRADQPCTVGYTPRHMDFAPAGLEMWGYSADARFVKDATLTFNLAELSERTGAQFDAEASATPRLRFSDDRIWTLVNLLSEVVDDADPASQLYGDGLTAAIASRLFARRPDKARPTNGLASWQLRLVIDRMESGLPEHVELSELAALTGLSQSYFSRAFKLSTGMAPYRWQLDARIRRARSMLADPRTSLADVAEATGFADVMHFGRTFRKFTGTTPAAWRRTGTG